MHNNLGISCAAKIFKISQPKAKILMFEVGPKSDLGLHDRQRHCFGSKIQFLVSRLRLHGSFSFYSHSDPLNMCFERRCRACKNIVPF